VVALGPMLLSNNVQGGRHKKEVAQLKSDIKAAKGISTSEVQNFLEETSSPSVVKAVLPSMADGIETWKDPKALDEAYFTLVPAVEVLLKTAILQSPNFSGERIHKAAKKDPTLVIKFAPTYRVLQKTREYLAFQTPDHKDRALALVRYRDSLPIYRIQNRLRGDLYPEVMEAILGNYQLHNRDYNFAFWCAREYPHFALYINRGMIKGKAPDDTIILRGD